MELLFFIIAGIVISIIFTAKTKNKEKSFRNINIANQNKINDYLKKSELLNCKKYISRDYANGIVFNEKKNEILLITKKFQHKDGSLEFNFNKFNTNKIMQSELVIDNQTIIYTSRGNQLAGMAVGGVLGGVVGMAIGGLSANKFNQEKIKSVNLKLLIEDTDSPTHKISFLSLVDPITGYVNKNGYSKNSSEVRTAFNNIEKWHGIMEVLIRQQNKAVNS